MSRDDLDSLLRTHLSSQLDRQRGRASHAFADHVSEWADQPSDAQPMRIGFGRRWAAAGLALAACVAIGFFVPRFLVRSGVSEQIADQAPKPSSKTIDVEMASLEQTTMLQHVDRGSAVLDSGQPARRISQQRVERYRWVDPQTNAQYEYVAPSEQDLLIQTHRQ